MQTAPAPDAIAETEVIDRLIAAVETVFRGKREVVRLSLAALLARGHVLFEDVPGVGKTTLAQTLAAAMGLDFRRVQFTSDLLPSDLLGVSVYNPRTHEWETRPGPIFAQVVLADEINRAPPRTQSGLLEAMQEGRVTIDDQTFALPRPFLVLATQNPLEQHGTYPLPESQLDRFLLRLSIGYPGADAEREILLADGGSGDPARGVPAVLDSEGVLALQAAVDGVRADPSLVDYVMNIVAATREHPRLRAGASTRAAVSLFRAARAYALVDGRRFLVPDDVRRLIVPCLAHRILPIGGSVGAADALEQVAGTLDEIATRTPVPV